MQLLRTAASLSITLLLGSTACAQTSNPPSPGEPMQPHEVLTVEIVEQPSTEPMAEPLEVVEEVAVEPETEPLEILEVQEPLEVVEVLEVAVEPEPVLVVETPEIIAEIESSDLPVVFVEQETAKPRGLDHSHSLWTAILAKHVKGSNFNYGALKKDQANFKKYLASLHAVTPEELKAFSKDQRYAFWINVYNAHTIQLVVSKYPLKGIRSLDGAFGLNSVFDKEFIPMTPHHPKGSNDKLSLNDIEHGILREQFKDARVHAAVNCASISCPPLRNEAFVAARLNEQLNAQMKAFINDKSRNEFDAKRGKVKASSIFKWFKEDFERDAGGVKEFMARYATDANKALLKTAKLSYLDYDWKLNDAK